jgi:hypothetical protein
MTALDFTRARRRKADTILAVIPVGATAARVAEIATAHAAMDRKARAKVAAEAGAREPSLDTWAIVVGELRLRKPDPFADDVATLAADAAHKICSCGARFSREQWERADYVGEQDAIDERYELRLCPACGTTMAVLVWSRTGNDNGG